MLSTERGARLHIRLSCENDMGRLHDLLKMGANPNIEDGTWGNTPLDYSV